MPHPHAILLVEDYPAGMMVSTMMLEHLGYIVDGVTSGQEAIDKIRLGATTYLAIMMDVNLPLMDGLETTKIIRTLERDNSRRNTIIAVTAHALSGDRERCLAAGMDDYISKPIHPDILAQRLAALIS